MSISKGMGRRKFVRYLATTALLGRYVTQAGSADAQALGVVARVFPILAILGLIWWATRDEGAAAPAKESDAARSARETAERDAALDAAHLPVAQAFAAYSATDLAFAKSVVRSLGIEIVQGAIDRKLAIWPEAAPQDLRKFQIEITNTTRQQVITRLHIAVDDVDRRA